MDPKVASELSLRIPHLALRMREHSARALHFAAGLQALGARVAYPGLPSHAQHSLLRRLANPGDEPPGALARRSPCTVCPPPPGRTPFARTATFPSRAR